MNQFVPKLFDCMKGYSKEQFVKDVIAGIIVAIIALPLSIALALASGVGPEQGIYTAIFAGFVISFLGGSRVQIAGPTAAFATIVAGIVAEHQMEGLVVATVMAGILLIIMGLLKFGNLIRFIPYTITSGFTFGIAVTIVIGQVKDFLGLTFTYSPVETIDKVKECVTCIGTIQVQALIVGLVSLAILIVFPKVTEKIPPSLIAVIVAILMVKLLHMNVKTIGDLYTISNKVPGISMPKISLGMIRDLFPIIESDNFVVTKGLDNCLFVYTKEDWQKFEEKLRTLPLTNKDARKFTRFFLAGAAEMEVDKQGRILIPSVLREFASLEKDVVFVGVGSRIEIWNRAGWDESISGYDDDMDEVAENMDSLGFTI